MEAGYLFVVRIVEEQKTERKIHAEDDFCLMDMLLALWVGWRWLKDTLYFDAYTTETESGLIAWILSLVGKSWRFPFVLLYGLIQPVLPAAHCLPIPACLAGDSDIPRIRLVPGYSLPVVRIWCCHQGCQEKPGLGVGVVGDRVACLGDHFFCEGGR